MCGLKSLQRHSRTVSTPLIGISLSRLPATHNDSTDLQEYSDTAFITNYIEDVTELKTITVWTNQAVADRGSQVYRLLKARNAAFTAGDVEGLRTARANLSRGSREAKRQYSKKISPRFNNSGDTRSLWQGLQIRLQAPTRTCDSTISLLNELNSFFARFACTEHHSFTKVPSPS